MVNKIKQLYYKVREKIYSIIFWYAEFYCINKKKVEKAKKYISNYLNNICKNENIPFKYVNYIPNNNKQKSTLGTYNFKTKEIIISKEWNKSIISSYFFNQECTFFHELGHHFYYKAGSNYTYDEEKVNKFALIMMKQLPVWVIQTMITSISTHYDLTEEQVKQMFNLTYYNIIKSEKGKLK